MLHEDPQHEFMRRSLTSVVKGFLRVGIGREYIANCLNALAAVMMEQVDPRTRVTLDEEIQAHGILLQQQGISKKDAGAAMVRNGVVLLAEATSQQEVSDLLKETAATLLNKPLARRTH